MWSTINIISIGMKNSKHTKQSTYPLPYLPTPTLHSHLLWNLWIISLWAQSPISLFFILSSHQISMNEIQVPLRFNKLKVSTTSTPINFSLPLAYVYPSPWIGVPVHQSGNEKEVQIFGEIRTHWFWALVIWKKKQSRMGYQLTSLWLKASNHSYSRKAKVGDCQNFAGSLGRNFVVITFFVVQNFHCIFSHKGMDLHH